MVTNVHILCVSNVRLKWKLSISRPKPGGQVFGASGQVGSNSAFGHAPYGVVMASEKKTNVMSVGLS